MRIYILSIAAALTACGPILAQVLPLPLRSVKIEDRFWSSRIETNRKTTVATVRQRLIESGAIDNFAIASGRSAGKYRGPFWSDSDVYKWLEGVSYSLALDRNPQLEAIADEVIASIAAAQQRDGYLNTYFQLVNPSARWTYLSFGHEMFNAGHLFEAAVAHFEATGKRTLLDIAIKNADHIDSVFGPGKHAGQPGHEEIELALVKLYRTTGERRYLRLAQHFIDMRGRKPSYFDQEYKSLDSTKQFEFLGRMINFHSLQEELFHAKEGKFDTQYSQDHLPVRQQDKVVGHAVRAMYLYSGMADIAAETGDKPLQEALVRLYADMTGKRMYVTGGVGPSAQNEGFTFDYDLPNATAYQETCASIGVAMWTQRMLAMTGDGQYADLMERTLYNATPAGVALSGDTFFYTNPLSSPGETKRSQWFAVPCCPTNVVRTIPSISRYIYGQSKDGLWINLYVQGEGTATFADGSKLTLTQKTEYPWDGNVSLRVAAAPATEQTLFMRVPGWTHGATFKLNGKPVSPKVDKGYAQLRRRWTAGDNLQIVLPMPVERMRSHPSVADNQGRLAVRRGPTIYSIEQKDHTVDIDQIFLPESAPLTPRFEAGLLGGVTVLTGQAIAYDGEDWNHTLYRTARKTPRRTVPLRAVPYSTWANRGLGKMAVWIKTNEF